MNRSFQCSRVFLLTTVILASLISAQAHRLDELLQAAQIDIRPEKITIRLYVTPGVAVANKTLRLIDGDKDGAISSAEATAYGQRLLQDLSARMDDQSLKLELVNAGSDSIDQIKEGTGNITLEIQSTLGNLPPGNHVFTFENRHQPSIGAYLINALLPKSERVQITKQERNRNQSTGQIHFTVSEEKAPGSTTSPNR